jgi:hypothetical protein
LPSLIVAVVAGFLSTFGLDLLQPTLGSLQSLRGMREDSR